MATVITREFVTEKLKRLFPNLDVRPNSLADQVVVQPIIDVFGDLSTEDFEDFLITRIKETNPDIITSPGSANYDILISTLTSIIEPLRIEMSAIKEWQSLKNYSSIPNDEMDSLVANYFVSRKQGSLASGRVRVYFSNPVSIVFNQFNQFQTRSGLIFRPISPQAISETVMAFNQEGSSYFVDVRVAAEEVGEQYNIASDQIVTLQQSNAPFTRVTNLVAFTGGANSETNSELYERTKEAITVRNLITKKSIKHVLLSEFDHVTDVEVVGFGDRDMLRDLEPFGINTTTTIVQLISGGTTTTLEPQTVTGANYIHVGGKVDIYAYTNNLTEDYIDIGNINYKYSLNLTNSLPYQVNTPIVRVQRIERLDPIYLSSTGQYIPHAKPIDVRALRDFAFSRDEYASERSTGTLRMFFEEPTMFEVDENTIFTAETGRRFFPINTQTIAASGMSINTGQNITKTEMDTNVIYNQDIVYYFFDVFVQSETSGDNTSLLSQGDYLTVQNYISEGWYPTTTDTRKSFSVDDTVIITFSPTFNDGIPTNGEAIRLHYEWAPTVKSMQDYVDDEENRVVTSDLLIRHFQPAYVDIAISYEGLIEEVDVEVQVRNFINELAQGTYFEISDLVGLLYDLGIDRIVFPIEVFVLIHNLDRSWTAVRFNDRYATPKRTHFIARNVDINKLR